MKRFLILNIGVFALIALPLAAGGGTTTYGDGVTIEKAVAIDALLANPDDYVGKNVRVDGVITGVCEKRGCWMQVTDSESGKGVRIKVEDGVMVFPYTSMGHEASAQGVFEAIKLTPEQVAARSERQAKEHAEGHAKKSCDKDGPKHDSSGESKGAACDAPTTTNVVYMIRGTGAVIKG